MAQCGQGRFARAAARLRSVSSEPRDIASLSVFRVLFGALLALSALRFIANGSVERCFGERSFFFKYWGFHWLGPLPVAWMYALYGLLALLGVCIALGLFYRAAIVLSFLLFSYVELTDVSNYLNHYYLVSLLALLLCFMPLSAAASLDVLRRPGAAHTSVPRWMLALLRFQIAVVYLYAALAKWGSDWLLYAEPLRGWLLPQADVPLIGPYLIRRDVALVASWAGMLHDLLIVPLLAWRRTRAYAFVVLVLFHVLTASWFNIGIFPVLMPIAATLFFEPDWPRRFLGAWGASPSPSPSPSPSTTMTTTTTTLVFVAIYCGVQLLLPLRGYLHGGNVLWHEQGMRFSWRVMVHAKYGSVRYRVSLPGGRELMVMPRRYLTLAQEREMSGQPDLILQLAHHIADEFRARGDAHVAVRADALVSLNGRAPAPLIDPRVDLTRIRDGLGKAGWICAAPREPPSAVSSKGSRL